MRGKFGRLFFIVILSLVLIGFYSTSRIVFADGKSSDDNGAPFLFIENIFPAPEELGSNFLDPLPVIDPPQTSELFDWNGEGSLFLQLIFELGNKKKVNAITEIEVFVNNVLISDFRVSKVVKEGGKTKKFEDVPTLYAEQVRHDYRFKTEFVVPFALPEDELKVHLEVRVQVSFEDEPPIEARKFVTLLNNQLLGTSGADSDWIISGNDMHSGVSGNVGIGTTSLSYKLEVKAPNSHVLRLSTEHQNSNVDIQGAPTGNGSLRFDVSGGANAISFNVNNIEKVRMDSNGNVGIGTTSPTGIFNVVDASPGGTISTTPLGFKVNNNYDAIVLEGSSIVGMTLASGRSTQSLIGFADEDDATAGFIQYIHLDDKLHLGSGNFARVTVDSSGNVGIGDTNPTEAKLVVNGTAGNFTGVWSNLSDRRLKKDIQPLEGSLSKVLNLQGISFHWKDSERGAGLQRGFLAREVEGVIPEWVKTDDDGYKRLEKVGVEALLVEAIKELKAEEDAEIATLKTENKAVMSENKDLKEDLLAMGERLDTLEDMYLAISTTFSKEKLVKYNQAGLDEVQKTIQ
jgi:hypothetical protein